MAQETNHYWRNSISNGCRWTLRVLVPGVAAYNFGKNQALQENSKEQFPNAVAIMINTFGVFPLAGACSSIPLNATDPLSIVVLTAVALTSGIIFNAELCQSGLKQGPPLSSSAPSRV